jgi:methionyl-tRNA formyltransferase
MIQPVLEESDIEIVGVIIYHPPPKSTRSKLLSSWKKGRRTSILVIIIEQIIKKIKAKLQSHQPTYYSTKEFFEKQNIPILELNKLYSPKSLDQISQMKGNIMYLFEYHGIVKPPIIQLYQYGVLSYHYGNMRKYRGQPAAFWEIYNHEKEMGITVQKISVGIDNGYPIEELTIPIQPHDTLQSLSDFIDKNCPIMLMNALKKVQIGYKPEKIEYGPLYTVPNLFQWLLFQLITLKRNIYRIIV